MSNENLNFVDPEDLQPVTIELENLYLDPNNPRFLDVKRIRDKPWSEKQITSENAQKFAIDLLMRNEEIASLKNSILSNGYIPMDRIVVREIKENEGSYVVLEGNRRTLACKEITSDHSEGDEVNSNVLSSFKKIDVLIYKGNDPDITWKLQGLRHVIGAKAWSLYAQAHHIHDIITKKNLSPHQAANSLGLKAADVLKMIRAYYVFLQAKEMDDFSDVLKQTHFSYYIEFMGGNKHGQEFLDFHIEEKKCRNIPNLHTFTSLIVPDSNGQRKLPMAIDSRKLTKALSVGKGSLIDDLQNETKDIDRIGEELKQETQGLGPILQACEDLVGKLGKIKVEDFETSPKAIQKSIDKLKRIIDTVQRKLRNEN